MAFVRHADRHYRDPDGSATRELTEYRQAVRLLRQLYGHTPAWAFGPLALKALRQKMIDAGWCRTLVNRRVARVKRIFRWLASEELVPEPTYRTLLTVPHLTPTVAGMVELQRLTGMRPGEVCPVRPCDLDTSGAVWLFSPPRHKGSWRGKPRVIAIGPKGQAVLNRSEPPSPTDYYFSPRRLAEEHRQARASVRKTPRWASHLAFNAARKAKNPKPRPAASYKMNSYGTAIRRACKRAGVEPRHPNQLRHPRGRAVDVHADP